MTFDFDRNSWHAFQGCLSMQVAPLASIKGLYDPTDHQCSQIGSELASGQMRHQFRKPGKAVGIDGASDRKRLRSRFDCTSWVSWTLGAGQSAYLASGATQERLPCISIEVETHGTRFQSGASMELACHGACCGFEGYICVVNCAERHTWPIHPALPKTSRANQFVVPSLKLK